MWVARNVSTCRSGPKIRSNRIESARPAMHSSSGSIDAAKCRESFRSLCMYIIYIKLQAKNLLGEAVVMAFCHADEHNNNNNNKGGPLRCSLGRCPRHSLRTVRSANADDIYRIIFEAGIERQKGQRGPVDLRLLDRLDRFD